MRFQFHYGTVKSCCSLCNSSISLSFQFHYGTVKSRINNDLRDNFRVFQFHYGTVKSPDPALAVKRYLYFNSTTVRLKVAMVAQGPLFRSNFNSTTVRLKEYAVYYDKTREIRFQFHYGTVKRRGRLGIRSMTLNFNSTTVRLKGIWPSRARLCMPNFNSTTVRLKGNRCTSNTSGTTISIPLRYG